MPSLEPGEKCVQAKTARIHKGRSPSWIGDDSQPHSGDLSVVGPWIEDDPQPRSVDLFVALNGQNHQIQRREDSQMARFEPAYPSFETPLRCE